ncbi:MAG: RNA polymerase sigma factor [Armatimonadota bacterium]
MDYTAQISQAASGDPVAFGQLVARYRGLVYAICLGKVGQAAVAEDLTQEVFLRVYLDLRTLHEPEKFLPWLRKVTGNVCRMWLRRQRTISVPLEDIAEQDDPVAANAQRRSELGGMVDAMLALVSPKSREVLILHYLAHCSEGEIAGVLGLTPATVKSRLYEARQQAKQKLLPVVEELLSFQVSSEDLVRQIMAKCGSPGCSCPDTLTERR